MSKFLMGAVLALAMTGCAPGQGQIQDNSDPEAAGRVLVGTLPEGVSAVFTLDTDGAATFGEIDGSGFSITVSGDQPVAVFVHSGDLLLPLQFERSAGGALTNMIPDFSGTIDLGAVSLVTAAAFRDANEDYAESENNPMDEVDSDGDGESDYDDADDDDDGVDDDDDADDDGDGEDDDDQDLDSDDDGNPDLSDEDDDDDGIEDDEDEDEADDEDGDGIDDDEDCDDDGDGEDDEEDDDDDGDGVDDEDDDDEEDDEDSGEDDEDSGEDDEDSGEADSGLEE